eukprot:scaffold31794_cov107-Isochrysis_galbana.AAC.4
MVRKVSSGPAAYGQNVSCCSVSGMWQMSRMKSFGCSRASVGKQRTTGSRDDGSERTRPVMTASTSRRTHVRRPNRSAESSAVSPCESVSSPILVEVAAAGDHTEPSTSSAITAGSVTTSVAYWRKDGRQAPERDVPLAVDERGRHVVVGHLRPGKVAAAAVHSGLVARRKAEGLIVEADRVHGAEDRRETDELDRSGHVIHRHDAGLLQPDRQRVSVEVERLDGARNRQGKQQVAAVHSLRGRGVCSSSPLPDWPPEVWLKRREAPALAVLLTAALSPGRRGGTWYMSTPASRPATAIRSPEAEMATAYTRSPLVKGTRHRSVSTGRLVPADQSMPPPAALCKPAATCSNASASALLASAAEASADAREAAVAAATAASSLASSSSAAVAAAETSYTYAAPDQDPTTKVEPSAEKADDQTKPGPPVSGLNEISCTGATSATSPPYCAARERRERSE